MRLTSNVYLEILKHSRAAVPAEAVGLLGGPSRDYATISIPLPNRANQRAFLADPFSQFKAERQLEGLGFLLLAIYHSHPDGGAQLSTSDLVFARKRTCLQIVIALPYPYFTSAEVRAFQVVENAPIEIELLIEK